MHRNRPIGVGPWRAVATPPRDLSRADLPVLLRIPFSHYCRKAEWGLSYRGIPYDALDISIPKMRQMHRANPGEGTVPVMLAEGQMVFGSGAILRWADAHAAAAPSATDRGPVRRWPGDDAGPTALYPAGSDDAVGDWERWADEEVGPVARREAYRAAYGHPWAFAAGRPHIWFGITLYRPVLLAVLKHYKMRRYEEADQEAVPQIIARIDAQLAESGGPYLFGATLTAADLATAALVAPLRFAGKAHGHMDQPGWHEVMGYVATVRPEQTLLRGRRRIRERDWRFLEGVAGDGRQG